MASEDTIIYQSEQCVISSNDNENETPRSITLTDDKSKLPRRINQTDEKLKTIRVNIKMVIRCPSANDNTAAVGPGTIAPPSTPDCVPSASLKDIRSTSEEKKSITSNPTTKRIIGNKRSNKAQSAPPKTIHSGFRKSENRTSYRILSSKAPPSYLCGTSSGNGRRSNNREKIVLTPFSERQKSNASAICFTCRRNLNTGQNVQRNGPEFGCFVGKRPLTSFTRLGCYSLQLKTTNIKFPGRPDSANSEMLDKNLKPPQQKQQRLLFRRITNVEAKTLSEQNKKQCIASKNTEDKVRTGTNIHGNRSSTKEFGFVFVKRNDLVEDCITTSNQSRNNIQKTQAEKLFVKNPENNMRLSKSQVVPFRRIFNSSNSSSGGRPIARNSSYLHRCANNALEKNMNGQSEYLAYQNRRLHPTRVRLIPFQHQGKTT